MLNAPDASEILPRLSSVARFLIVRAASVTAAPEGSCTVPSILPVGFSSADASSAAAPATSAAPRASWADTGTDDAKATAAPMTTSSRLNLPPVMCVIASPYLLFHRTSAVHPTGNPRLSHLRGCARPVDVNTFLPNTLIVRIAD